MDNYSYVISNGQNNPTPLFLIINCLKTSETFFKSSAVKFFYNFSNKMENVY